MTSRRPAGLATRLATVPSAVRRGLLVATPVAVLLGITGGVLVATTGSSDASDVPSRGVPEALAVKPVRTSGESVVQFMAHPDDDLFFMNPDTSQSIASGRSLTSVYLTAGESDGRNNRRGDPRRPADKAAYAEARQNGIRAAYAEMATGDRTSPWDRTEITIDGGARAELNTLRSRPQISLVWLQLKEAGTVADERPNSLHGLWDGKTGTLGSQLAAGSPVREDFAYTREQVVATIDGVLRRFRPTFVRMLDPTPGLNERTGRTSDHQDHTYGARFVQAALARYAGRPGRPAFGVQSYLGYSTGSLPHSLDPGTFEAKLRTLKTYAWTDHTDYCEDPAGCGDRKVAGRPAGRNWAQSIRYARSGSTSWVQPGAHAGELYAFGVLDGRLAVWHRAGKAAKWAGPVLQEGAGLDGGVVPVRLPDGRISVYGTRTDLGGAGGGYRREVAVATQASPGGVFGPWRSLGSPQPGDAGAGADISMPAVVVDRAGLAAVYVRDGRHAMSMTVQRPDGGFAPWQSAGGRELRGDPVAAVDATGRGHVFAATPKTVLTWTHPATPTPASPSSPSLPMATGLPPTTVALSAAPDGRDGVRLWFREPVSGDARSARFTGGGRPVGPVTEVPGGRSGHGAVVSAPDRGGLALRGRPGGLAVAPAPGRPWTGGGGPLFSGAPAIAPGGVAALTLDGRLTWTPWHP
ncbi:PIG-L family deacetylase [Streptomyces sp. NPDC047097]|uniref:PIG-L family deacetylase n=1 Tax=Streptomyces sp. NPDC047097 TaxID=3155260 RepID=UPI0033CD8419